MSSPSPQGSPTPEQAAHAILEQQMQTSAPWTPLNWGLGGIPTVGVDIPITAVFLFLYICGAATHMTIFQLNLRRGHKFVFSGMLFGFCMARTVTCILRIATISVPDNIRLKIAASIFVAAGVLLIYIINLLFAQRLIRATHPNAGWGRAFHYTFMGFYIMIGVTFAMVITVTIQQFYTLSINTRRIDRDFQLYAASYLGFISILPFFLVVGGLIIPRKTRVEKFGSGRFRTKVIILLTSTIVISLGAWFRAGTNYKDPVLITAPRPAYFSRACFYIFNFAVEVIVVYLYAILRIDLRFHIPNGARGPGSYTPPRKGENTVGAGESDMELEHKSSGVGSLRRQLSRVYSEEETFDDIPDPETTLEKGDEQDVEQGLDPQRSRSLRGSTAVHTPV